MLLSGLLYALLAVLVASFGARDQALVADLGQRQGRRPLLLLVALLATACTTALAAWAGARMLGSLMPQARVVFAAIALLAAGAEMMLFGPRRVPDEPTHSLFAAWLVLMGLQITDAARFLALALAVGTAAPVPVGIGATAGGMAALALGWAVPEWTGTQPLGWGRRAAGAVLVIIGLLLLAPRIIG